MLSVHLIGDCSLPMRNRSMNDIIRLLMRRVARRSIDLLVQLPVRVMTHTSVLRQARITYRIISSVQVRFLGLHTVHRGCEITVGCLNETHARFHERDEEG